MHDATTFLLKLRPPKANRITFTNLFRGKIGEQQHYQKSRLESPPARLSLFQLDGQGSILQNISISDEALPI